MSKQGYDSSTMVLDPPCLLTQLLCKPLKQDYSCWLVLRQDIRSLSVPHNPQLQELTAAALEAQG